MVKRFLVLLVIVLASCNNKSNTPKELILGNWVEVKRRLEKDDIGLPPPFNDTLSYEFRPNGVCDFKQGYFDYEGFYNDTSEGRVISYLGTTTKYNLTKNLNIYNPSNKKWDSYKIKRITSDSLLIDNGSEILFVKKHYDTKHSPDFDTVILSSSPCYGSCPVNDIMIDKNGNVAYCGTYSVKNKGFYLGKIKTEEFDTILQQFKEANYFNLNPDYFATHTDDSTVYVTFIKNGKIIKSVEDYGSAAPKEFVWAYNPLIYKVQHIKLKNQKSPKFLDTDVSNIVFPKLNLNLSESEFFYLLSKLRMGNEVNNKFEEKYVMYYYNKLVQKVMTDGRYYKFYLKDGNVRTIDIGFDFLKTNTNNKELK